MSSGSFSVLISIFLSVVLIAFPEIESVIIFSSAPPFLAAFEFNPVPDPPVDSLGAIAEFAVTQSEDDRRVGDRPVACQVLVYGHRVTPVGGVGLGGAER